ncbi:AAA family ATPase, partial [Streptomyces sp. UNOC14_S4]|uniref:ATP-binding protein n=1 Tax=Streptomyces sp. UNOC14_S4 TaxID=2872340 RepID=UPI001E459824
MNRVLLERDGALAEAAGAGDAARSGDGRWLLFGAGTGLGRTALLEEVIRREAGAEAAEAADGAMRVLHARCSPEESEFPFALVRQVFPEGEDIPFADLPAPDEQRLFHRLVARLAQTAARGPVLLAVDDLHDADAVSRRWIGYLARRLAGLPVLLVLTECQEREATPLPPATGTSVTLRPLGPATVSRLAHAADRADGADRAECDDRAEWAELCVQACAGNPALVHALLADLGAGRIPKDDGSRYRDTITRWLRTRATPRSRRVALALAVTGDGPVPPVPLVPLREVIGPGPDAPTGTVSLF